jgi:hypothetical protein
VDTYRVFGARLPYNGVNNKVDNGGRKALDLANPLWHVDLLDPNLVQSLLALVEISKMVRWLLFDRQSPRSSGHLDRFRCLLLQILLKSCIARGGM